MSRRRRRKSVDRFLKYYRKLNKEQLRLKLGPRRPPEKERRALMRKIRKNNKPVLDLARSLHAKLRKFALKRGRRYCVLGIDERLVRDTWDLALSWSSSYK